jgi:3-hydroxyacyl-CoA dehydrogenase
VIVENLAVKHQLMERIDAVRAPYTIVTTNTSGIPVASIAEGRSESFRQHFLGTHFFNPPRYLKLLEIIPTADTLPAVVEIIKQFAEYRLGKGVVLAKDTPNFIANRLASVDGAYSMEYVLEHEYTVNEVDTITGPAVGRPKTATFRLLDLVGIDVWEHVGGNLAKAIPYDESAQLYLNAPRGNQIIHAMVERGLLGNKSRQGFYKEVISDGKKEFWVLNLKTLEYEAPSKPRFPSLGKTKDVEKLGERLKVLLEADDRAGELVRALTFHDLAYASSTIPEIADTPLPIDNAICWGFGHEAGPFEVWDSLGVAATLARIKAAGFAPAAWVDEMLASGHPTFYRYEGDRKVGIYNPGICDYVPIERPAGLVVIKEQKAAGKLLVKNPSASLVDLGDGVACVEFHAKMNVLDDDMFNMIQEGLDRAEKEFEGLVIGTQAENFSAGANLFMVVMGAQNGMWDQLDSAIRKMQGLNMRMRYFPRPVIIAPSGLALGGGSEITMHGGRVIAAAELYAGLVEFGAGVIPAGGGTKEMLRRIINPPMRTQNANPLPFLQRVFEQVGLAKVGTSAEEARQMGILSACDRIVMNRDYLIAEAKQEVLELAGKGYHPPLPEEIFAAGRDARAALQVAIYMMKEGGYITEHETVIAGKLANTMTGGEISRPAWVSEQYILDLEREAFLSLCGEQKTQQRMWNLLQTGKVLRN